MKHILFLADGMSMGFGVSVVIGELSSRLVARGWCVSVGCREYDHHFSQSCKIIKLDPKASAVEAYANKHNVDYIIAHTTPYFEILPHLNGPFEKWAWEHGDPTPSLFPFDRHERQKIIDYKKNNVYPHVDRVVAISKFIRQDIDWPLADIIYNGCGHVETGTPKKNLNDPLTIGALMRLGKGEQLYKGGNLYIELVKRLSSEKISLTFGVLGRGTPEDGAIFKRVGIKTHINATDEERATYLKNLDIFLSLSLWEGFNLPLVEAQASGKLAIGFDTGAHPEVTPFIVTGIEELSRLLLSLNNDRDLLYRYTIQSQTFCLKKFSWEASVDSLLQLMSR